MCCTDSVTRVNQLTFAMKTTKELARELGLIRKRSASTQEKNLTKFRKTNQVFSYLIVIDFESTCWRNEKYRSQEIIEFPAVLLNTRSGQIEAEFQHYVQPQENPVLSEFCIQLTGITQAQVEAGIPLPLVLRKFSQWLTALSKEKNITYNAQQSAAPMQRCTFVTWSDWDLGVCLQYECRRKQLRKPLQLNSWLDLRATYRTFYGRKPCGLNGALQEVGIEFEGREHSGLHDARNTARLAWRMMCDGCMMQITKTVAGPGQFGTQHSADRGSRQKALSVMSTAHTATGPDSETDTATETATHLEISAKTSEAASFTTTTSSDFSLQSIAKGHLLGMSPTNSAMAKSLFSSVYCDPKSETSLNSTPQRSVFQSTKAPTSKGLNDVTNRWKSTPLSMSAPLESFLVKETPDSGDKTLKSLGFPAATSSTRLRRTPPLCSCGKRSKRKAVQTPGPNVGRFFFCCPSGKDRCGFFKWEISIETPRSLSRGYCTPRTVALSKSTESFILPPLPQPNFDTPGSHVGTALRTKTLGVQRYAVPKPVVSLQ